LILSIFFPIFHCFHFVEAFDPGLQTFFLMIALLVDFRATGICSQGFLEFRVYELIPIQDEEI